MQVRQLKYRNSIVLYQTFSFLSCAFTVDALSLTKNDFSCSITFSVEDV